MTVNKNGKTYISRREKELIFKIFPLIGTYKNSKVVGGDDSAESFYQSIIQVWIDNTTFFEPGKIRLNWSLV
jgi:hypothetical protein